MKHSGERIANWVLTEDTSAPWTAHQLFTAVQHLRTDEFDKLVLDAQLKPPHSRTELETALMTKGILTSVKKLRSNEADKKKLAGALKYLNDGAWLTHAKFPGDCQNMDQEVLLPDGNKISLYDFITGPQHLEYSLLLLGAKQLGKSPFVRAVGRYWTIGRLGEHEDGSAVPLDDLFFAYCATASALNKVSALGLMTTKRPVIIDDSDVQDNHQNRTGGGGDWQGLRQNYLKHMLNVQDGGEVGARFNQVTFAEKQPRVFVSNDNTIDEWLPRGFTANHKEAILKRIAICTLDPDRPLIKEAAREVYKNTNVEEAAAMRARFERLGM